MKKYITPINVVLFLWLLTLFTLQEIHPDYIRYFQYLSLLIIIPITIINLVKQKKEDKLNDTTKFRSSIYRMLIMASILVIFFFITKQSHI
jgi:predicted Na+-dependent transporter